MHSLKGKFGELSNRWQGGKPKCINCKKQLKNHGSKRCASCAQKGSLNPNYGKLFSSEHKRKIGKANSIVRKGRSLEQLGHKLDCICCVCKAKRGEYKGKKHPMFNRYQTIESKEKASNTIKEQYRNNRISWNKCKKMGPFSEEQRKNLSLALGGTGIPYENNLYPYEFFRIRNKILEKYNYTCQLCSEYGNEVHHIDYNKENNDEENLTCLCHKCNIKVNFNREYWEKYFTKK